MKSRLARTLEQLEVETEAGDKESITNQAKQAIDEANIIILSDKFDSDLLTFCHDNMRSKARFALTQYFGHIRNENPDNGEEVFAYMIAFKMLIESEEFQAISNFIIKTAILLQEAESDPAFWAQDDPDYLRLPSLTEHPNQSPPDSPPSSLPEASSRFDPQSSQDQDQDLPGHWDPDQSESDLPENRPSYYLSYPAS